MLNAVLRPGFEPVKHFPAQCGKRREGEIGEGVFARLHIGVFEVNEMNDAEVHLADGIAIVIE